MKKINACARQYIIHRCVSQQELVSCGLCSSALISSCPSKTQINKKK